MTKSSVVQGIVAGQRFGRLEVVQREPRFRFRCRCTCGNEVSVYAYHLASNRISSCGCLRSELRIRKNTTHGMTESRVYAVWRGIMQRCTNPRSRGWASWGGRGISVHPSWRGHGGFAAFYAHVGEPPFPGAEMDRIDNNGNYEPGNVRWATRMTNANNTRRNRRVTLAGESKTLSEWSRELGVPVATLVYRLAHWDEYRVLTTPRRCSA